MAKQNVGFGERHLEKFVVGAAGAVLAAILFLYAVQDPYVVTVAGESVGPSGFYARVDEAVSQAVQKLKSAGYTPPDDVWKPPQVAKSAAVDIPLVYVPIHPAVPLPDTGVESAVKVELAAIVAPGKPVVVTGRGTGVPPTTEIWQAGEPRPAKTGEEAAKTTDQFWVTAFAPLNRQAQRQLCMASKYDVERQRLVVTEVQMQRQRLLPSGEWQDPPVDVNCVREFQIKGPATVELVAQDNERIMTEEDYKYVEAVRQQGSANQPRLLRPAFKLEDPRKEWRLPAAFPDGTVIDWEDLKVEKSRETAVLQELPPTQGVAATRFDYKKAKAEIDAAIKNSDYVKAKTLLDKALAAPGILAKDKKEVEDTRTQIEPRAQDQIIREARAREARVAAAASSLGPDMDALWAHDFSATPGETFRYRVRVVALNEYAGLLLKLKNPGDAAKVLLPGEWSEWSDPVTLAPGSYLFFTGMDSAQNAKVELWTWSGGAMKKGDQTLALGSAIAFTKNFQDFSYDGVIAAMDGASPYEERSADKRSVRYQSRPTLAVALVSASGDVEEHFAARDLAVKRAVQQEKKDEQKTPGTNRPLKP